MVVMTEVKALAIIPARGGSKGIPNKNIIQLSGKPLMNWTIEACLQSSFVSRVIVSSDDEDILETAIAAGSEALTRPLNLASDEALTVPVISHVIESLGEQLIGIRYIVLMQPTSPLRTASHLNSAFQKLLTSNASSLISVVKPNHSPLKSFLVNDSYLKGIVNDEYPFMGRQDLPATYQANGAIYIVDIDEFQMKKSLLTEKCIPFEMDANSSIDIDNYSDLKLAEEIISDNRLIKKTKYK